MAAASNTHRPRIDSTVIADLIRAAVQLVMRDKIVAGLVIVMIAGIFFMGGGGKDKQSHRFMGQGQNQSQSPEENEGQEQGAAEQSQGQGQSQNPGQGQEDKARIKTKSKIQARELKTKVHHRAARKTMP